VACCVCGVTAGPHNYYGARACIPCRAFFRRSVEEQLFGAYVCYRTKDCDVKRTGRKSCKYCRFQACLKGGMKAVYVLNESQKEQLNKKKIKIKEEPSVGSFTSKDEEDIKRWTGLSRIFDQSKVRTFEKTVIKELIRLVMFTNPLSERSKQTLKNKLDIKAKEFIEKMEQFVQLPHQDQSLIKVLNIPVVTAMQACSFFSPGWSLQLGLNLSS